METQTQTLTTSELRASIAASETALDSLRGQLESFSDQLAEATEADRLVLERLRVGLDTSDLTEKAGRKTNLARIASDLENEVAAAATELDRQRGELAHSEKFDDLERFAVEANSHADEWGAARAHAANVLLDALNEMKRIEDEWGATRKSFNSIGLDLISDEAERWEQEKGAARTVPGEVGAYAAKIVFAGELLGKLEAARGVDVRNVASILPSRANITDLSGLPKPEAVELLPLLASVSLIYEGQVRGTNRPTVPRFGQ